MHSTVSANSWNDENTFTGKVTCSVPFCKFRFLHCVILDNNYVSKQRQTVVGWSRLVARRVFGLDCGMTLGVSLITFEHILNAHPRNFSAMRRVLHLKMVSQCAMLEDFGIFLVLADKVNSTFH
jgi:hypothetical protein